MTTVWWVRHGPTHVKAMVGWSDVPADLSDTDALARLSAYLPEAPVMSSDLTRAVDTATALQEARPRLPHQPDLRELNFGDWELKTAKELEAEDKELARAYWDDPEANRPPNGETWGELDARVSRAIAPHVGQQEHLIAVAHFGVILTQLRHALDVSVYEVLGQKIDNLSVTALRFDGARWHAEVINHIP